MFDGMPDQFYQFLAAATTTSRTTVATNNTATTAGSIQLPLSFSLHHHNYHGSFPSYSPPPPPQPPPPSFDPPYHLLHHSQFITRNNSQVSKDNETLNLQHDDNVIPRSLILPEIPWSNDEMLALFKIRSSMDNTWFPDFIWENVSRKLAELGFKRSAEKCKEKFEEETRSFNSSIISNNTNNTCSNKNNPSNNYRLFGELEELCNNNTTNTNDSICHGGDDHHPLPLPPSPPPQPPPPPPLPPSLTDQAKHPESLLSQRNECLGGDNEDEDGENSQVGEDKEEKEELGDDEEGEDDTKNGDDDDDDNDNDDDDDNNVEEQHYVEDDDSEKTEESTKKVIKKRKREKKFEMFKGFCEQIVNKMMAQQEQLHSKILQDMVKRDEEKIAKEEAWKKQEIERLQKELEVRAHEQAIVGDRQAKILDCLNKFNSSPSSSNILDSQFLKETLENLNKVPNLITLSNSSILTHDNSISAQLPPTTSCTTTTHDHNNNLSPLPNNTHQTCLEIPTSSSSENVALFSPIRIDNSKVSLPMSSPSMDRVSQNPNILSSHNDLSQIPSLVSSHNTSRLDHTSTNATDESDHPKHVRKDDTRKRWPRDEVLALINIRCSLFNNNGGNNDAPSDRESFSKAPLWERISQKMTELGYKRSAKRCKEKWENINKYFRKTKDLNKKRSIDSRTCPYFHQLSHLYNQGTLVGSSDRPVNQPGSPESHRSMTPSGPQGESSNPPNAGTTNNMNASQGVVQVPGFDFEF